MTARVPNIGKLIIADIKKALYTWVRNQTKGILPDGQNQIIWRDQSQPLPARPCVTLRFTSGPRRVGYQDWPVPTADNSNSQFLVGGQREATVSVQIYGNPKIRSALAEQLATDLNSSLSLPTVLAQLSQAGIAILNQGDVTNISDLEESEFEDRAEFSILIGLAENVLDDPGTIQSIGAISHTIDPQAN